MAVKYARGSVVALEPHPEACETPTELISLATALKFEGKPLAADLFCGAGGMSLGLRDAGFEVVVGVDNDPEALLTHRSLFPGLHLGWDLAEEDRVDELADLLTEAGVDLIAGGPPCQPFSKAGRSLIRDLVRQGRRPGQDLRRDLWQSFLAIVERVRPRAVLMENVPDMALERDMLILRTMVDELERLGYAVEARVVETSRYGVPQYRQRLILIALANNRRFRWPHEQATPSDGATLWDAIGDLPDVEPGWDSGDGAAWAPYEPPANPHPLQLRARRGMQAENQRRVFDHVTRAVREDDLEAFSLLTPEMKYSDLPDRLKRYRDDIFDDKYKRLSWNDLCRTITAHIAKDGYWYIHPVYDRTLTVREAARVQTFTDEVRFAGPPTAAFRQIGNAVPPLLAEGLGKAIREALTEDLPQRWATKEVSAALAKWFTEQQELSVPWLRSPSRWIAVQAELLLARARPDAIRPLWRFLSGLERPGQTLEQAATLERLAGMIDRAPRAKKLVELASRFEVQPELLESRAGMTEAGVPESVVDAAMRICPTTDEDPVLAPAPLLRVAHRFHDSHVHARNKSSDGRIEVARLVGVDPEEEGVEALSLGRTGHLAHLALLELSSSVCLARRPRCDECPLREWCAMASERALA